MTQHTDPLAFDQAIVETSADNAGRMIPPVWPLASSVAVNPFLGQMQETLAQAGARLARISDIPAIMPRAWYQEKIASGEITDDDLTAALAASVETAKPDNLASLKQAAGASPSATQPLRTIAELAANTDGTDWPGLFQDRFGVWASGYFDDGQALWAAPREASAFESWRMFATHDLTPEIQGLKGFAAKSASTPIRAIDVITQSVKTLALPVQALECYFHQLLLSLGGWAQYARHLQWKAELGGSKDTILIDLLAIRLLWEEALYLQNQSTVETAWSDIKQAHGSPISPSPDQVVDAILQDAADRAGQRDLSARLGRDAVVQGTDRPALQAAFCIDVRSEVFRRALEAVNPSIRTLGFAGFFGVFAKHKRFASDVDELRLPVLLNPTVSSCSGTHGEACENSDHAARSTARAKRAWGRFKQAAVSSFAFVEAAGPVYAGKLISGALGLEKAPVPNDPAPQFDPPLDDETRIGAAETVLRAMSLTEDFARLVILAGHGANVVNNPHASGLHCGACGGYSGEVNARLLAGLLNDKTVRNGLLEKGIAIPADTLFVGALHDTTTDRVTLYDGDVDAGGHQSDLALARNWLATAGKVCRGERADSLPQASSEMDIARRARDWAETRPEWALARCKAFIAAPRKRTGGKDMQGRAFLHDYDWTKDSERGFPVLELIMTAPVVVASWISLQYYGSTVAPKAFGSGNKLLHNVVGGVGVLEGNGGPLRAGLAWQSVHDGERFVHDPRRLSVCIEAPVEAMTAILKKHAGVRALFDNGWLHLFALDSEGQMAQRYSGDLAWEPVGPAKHEIAEKAVA